MRTPGSPYLSAKFSSEEVVIALDSSRGSFNLDKPLLVFAYRRRESPCTVAARLALIALWDTPFMSAQGCFLGGIPAVMSLSRGLQRFSSIMSCCNM